MAASRRVNDSLPDAAYNHSTRHCRGAWSSPGLAIECAAWRPCRPVNRLTTSFLPPITLDLRSKTPLYRQIAVWFQRAIVDGQLRPGQRVPSTRALADELKISRIPVLGAYELLIAEGYLRPFVGAGTCVSESIPDGVFGPRGADRRVRPRSALSPAANVGRRVALPAMPGPCAGVAREGARLRRPDVHFPVREWSRLVNRHARKLSREVMGYSDAMGYWPFREAVAEYLGAFRGVTL